MFMSVGAEPGGFSRPAETFELALHVAFERSRHMFVEMME